MQRAYELWEELEGLSGRELLRITGGLMIGRPEGVLVTGARASAVQHRLPHELLTATEVSARFPALRPADDMVALWEPRAGILLPEACFGAHLALSSAHAPTLACGEPVTGWQSKGRSRSVCAPIAASTRPAQLLLTAGCVDSFARAGTEPAACRSSARSCAGSRPRANAATFAPARCPIHLWESAPAGILYGFPDLGEGVKLALHHAGEITDPHAITARGRRRGGSPAVRALMRRYLPDGDGPLRSTGVCMYTNTPAIGTRTSREC